MPAVDGTQPGKDGDAAQGVRPLRIPLWVGWGLAFVFLLWFLSSVSGVLLPFLTGLAIAYLLDPVADRLEARKVPRWLATVIVLSIFFSLVVAIGFAAAPIIASQVQGMAAGLPGYIERVRPFILDLVNQAGGEEKARALVGDASAQALQWASQQLGQVVTRSLALFNILSLILISPVVAFYLLRDYDRMVAQLESWLPRAHEPVIRDLLIKADQALSGFVRGQSLVCIAMGTLYAIGWALVGLDYALVLGVLAGILAFVPFVGPFIGAGLAVIVAIGQFDGALVPVALTVGVFVVVQIVESGVLTPNLIGDRVGLHPVWILFAVLAGAELLGFVGVLIAVPAAAVLAVISRWLLELYLQSRYYHGEPKTPEGGG